MLDDRTLDKLPKHLTNNGFELERIGAEGQRKLSGLKILLIEDDSTTRRLLAKVLEIEGAEATEAGSADEALLILSQKKVDLVISDISMPERDGWKFIQALRQMKEAPWDNEIPAIALSALSSEEAKRLSIERGYQIHLGKPVNRKLLVEVILQLAAQKSVH